MNQKKQDKGFTLVELLIVIVILGILATVTVFAVRGITQDAQTNSCATERRTIETAIEAFNANNQADATSIADLGKLDRRADGGRDLRRAGDVRIL